jgi:hypothetical protein
MGLFHARLDANHMRKFPSCLFLILLTPILVGADDRTLNVGIYGFLGAPPTSTIVSVTVGSVSNQNPTMIAFYVEFSDDLSSWKPLQSFNACTNGQPTIATNLTNGQMALFLDGTTTSHRFYRAVEAQ